MMEIERKFLVKETPNLEGVQRTNIYQFYLSSNLEIRIREIGGVYRLTLKTKGTLERKEVELSITEEEFNEIKELGVVGVVEKTRHFIPDGENLIELDVYSNIPGLITAEIEFESVQEAELFTPPKWFYKEITSDPTYKNKNLAVNGLTEFAK